MRQSRRVEETLRRLRDRAPASQFRVPNFDHVLDYGRLGACTCIPGTATMPLRGTDHSDHVRDELPYFTSLEALDQWAGRADTVRPLSGVLPYEPRSSKKTSEGKGKLLVI